MKEIILLVFFFFIGVNSRPQNRFSVLKSQVDLKTQKIAAEKLLERVLLFKARYFDVNVSDMPIFPNDGFQISKTKKDNLVRVIGPNAISVVWGVHYYLKNYCNCHISWDGDQLKLPDELPTVNIMVQSLEKFRFYQNPCASSYSYAWWGWERWEREIDWMALNGINLALAFNGQEAIWQRVYDGFGLPSNDFTGSGFLAWYRMGNIKSFSHGLTEAWHKGKVTLQHKILKRMRQLGITPVLPGFCGIVPSSFKTIFPKLKLVNMSRWGKFSDEYCCPSFLQPSDSLFEVIAQIYYREYIKEFGTNNIYSCDIYNENIPAKAQARYLKQVSSGIFKGMVIEDPFAIWMLQGWMFKNPFWEDKNLAKAFLKGVPIGRLLILDLQSDLTPQYERLNGYFGHSFIWCTLHNFGGQLGIYGHLERINNEIIKGRKKSTMIGIGIVPEGIDQNYIIYDFTLEGALRKKAANLTDWVSKYATRRYMFYNETLIDAWLILKDTAYNYDPTNLTRETPEGPNATTTLLEGEHISKNILTQFPTLELNELIWYNKSKMYEVYLKFLLVSSNNTISSSTLFRHDFIDVTRQTIQFVVSSLYFKIIEAFKRNEFLEFENKSTKLLKILDELDIILKTGRKFLFGPWVRDAMIWGINQEEVNHYSYDARNQITLWGPHGELRDYAAKQWSGLIVDFYKPRWAVFIEVLADTLAYAIPYNETIVKEKIFLDIEKPFVETVKLTPYAMEPEGDTIKVIQNFNRKWEPVLREIFKE